MWRKRAAISIARSPLIPTMSRRSSDLPAQTCMRGWASFVTDPTVALAAAETKLTKALSVVPDHARAHLFLGFVDIFTRRAEEGIAECEYALTLDRNLANAHSIIAIGKIFSGRAEEAEAHIGGRLHPVLQ